ncbi:MAG TPA: MOSC N-terminal beta barrel domain-containing protein [Acidimicrobiales bacterium]|nr:MOSC N-terminal beta barrel domain-containing protein [Acidimicrobiales bacterium]
MSDVVGAVSALMRYPVKSMLGEEVDAVEVAAAGVVGDRAYALVDEETGKVVSVKRPRRWGRIFEFAAASGGDGVTVAFPDGTRVAIDDRGLPRMLSDFFGRDVSVADVPPAGATFDEAWVRDLKNDAGPYFDIPSRVEEGDELVDAGAFMSAGSNFFNFGAVHIVTTSTLRRLSESAPDSRIDARRFRPNIVVKTDEEGFVETAWQGRELTIGAVRLSVTFTVPRCVMTTLPQGDLPADPDVLRAITEHNAVDTFATGVLYPCVGVYADVKVPGRVARGDQVTVEG